MVDDERNDDEKNDWKKFPHARTWGARRISGVLAAQAVACKTAALCSTAAGCVERYFAKSKADRRGRRFESRFELRFVGNNPKTPINDLTRIDFQLDFN